MAWEVLGRDIVVAWARQSDDPGAMLAVVLWLERIASHGPSAHDDVVGSLGRVHTEDSVMVLYEIEPAPPARIRIRSVVDLGTS